MLETYQKKLTTHHISKICVLATSWDAFAWQHD